MNIDYNDQRFQNVNNEKQVALNRVNDTYNNMINQSDQYYNDLSKAYEDYGNKQQEIQQQQSDLALKKIEQNQEYTKKDYEKEQKAAYQDYMKQTDRYGVNAEQMAQNGLLGTGYSESSKVSMYNAYQNRVATARESFNRSWTEYENQKTQAIIDNNSALAQLAFDTLKAKLEYSLQGFQYKNNLLQTQIQLQNETEDRYYNKWKDVLSQINTEKAFEYQKERDRIADQQWQKEYNLSKQKLASSSGVGSISKTSSTNGKIDANNIKSTGTTAFSIFAGNLPSSIDSKSKIYESNGNYFISDKSGNLIDITSKYKEFTEAGNNQGKIQNWD